MAIEPSVLPARAMLDTGVMIRALGEHPSDVRSPACVELWSGLLAKHSRLLIAAPTVAEYLRKGPSATLPRVPGIVVVPFDAQAATLLGLSFPADVLKTARSASGLAHDYIKYDALIVACALRHRADCLVTIDGDISGLASRVHLPCRTPEDFQTTPQPATLPLFPTKP